jgi:hypothetical protein
MPHKEPGEKSPLNEQKVDDSFSTYGGCIAASLSIVEIVDGGADEASALPVSEGRG